MLTKDMHSSHRLQISDIAVLWTWIFFCCNSVQTKLDLRTLQLCRNMYHLFS